MNKTFTPKPSTMLYPVAMFSLGVYALQKGSTALCVAFWVLGWLIVGWVIVADIMSRRVEYWESVADVLNASSKNDITKLASLGFTQSELPEAVKIELHDRRDGMNSTKYFDLPVPSAKIVPLASALLNGQPFSEKRWTGADGLLSTNEFRTLRGVMRDRGLVQPVNPKDNRQGFELTDAGRELLSSLLPSPPPLGNMS